MVNAVTCIMVRLTQARECKRSARSKAVLSAIVCSVLFGDVIAAESDLLKRYEVTTRTGMPNLDEALRYATRTELRCLDVNDLSRVFWMLGDASLQDCSLVKRSQGADSAQYDLLCSGGHGTTGKADWQLNADAIAGTMNVRLGGKNMTFYQRVTARPVGECD